MRKGVRTSTLPPSGRRKSFVCGVVYVINYFIVLNAVTAGGRSSFGGELTKLNVLAGGVIELNCSRSDDETPFLVVWYKGEEPIYSYDARDIEKTATNWSHREYFGQRASLGQYAALIHIDPVILEDTGEYRCRVDFRNIPTRNAKFLLTVIVPPEHPEIYDIDGKQLQKTAGPFLEGLSVRLTCIVRGGVPPPSLVWYQGQDRMNSIDISSNYALAEKTKAEQISILDLNRKDRGTSYSCHCNHPSLNLKETVIIDMYLRTERVEIFRDLTPFSSGRRHEVKCQAEGSIPPPTIGWFIGDKHLTDFMQTDSDDGNSSVSTLFYTPTKIDDGKVLTCRAHNNYIPKEFMDDKMTLDVYYAPIMKLKLGMQMNPLDIEATDDVYFECLITSNPNAYKVIWKHNGQILQHSSRLGIITSNTHLALQTVSRHQAGNYTCTASNVEGDGVSNIVDLKVMYKPFCMDSQKKLYGLAKGEKAVISCMVDSYPAPSAYRWAFNNTAETRDLTEPPLQIQEKPYTSVLSYTPLSENDYGTVLCWALNVPGRQREPCVFHIIPGGKPDPPYNCTLLNQTVESLDVECFGGFDGGQEQIFVMEVYDQKAQLQVNVSSFVPRFMVSGLKPGMELYLDIFAANRRGRSEKANLEYLMLRSPEIQTTEVSKPVDFKLVAGILFGIFVTMVIMVAVILYALKASRKSGEVDEDFAPPVHGHAMKEKGTFPHACSETESVYGDKNPDVIRFNKGTFHREPAFPESDYQAETNLSVLNMEEWHLPSPLSIAAHLPPPPHQVTADPQSLQFGDLRIKHPQYDYLLETQNGKMVGAVYGHTDYPVCLDSAVSIRPVREVVTVRTPLMFNQQQESCV